MRNDGVGGETPPILQATSPARRKTRRISDGCDGAHAPEGVTPLMPGISTNAAGISWEACGIGNALLCHAVYFTAILSMRF